MKKILKIFKRIFLTIIILIAFIGIIAFIYMRQPQFGRLPSGERLAFIEKSLHYKDGQFQNNVEKPTISEGFSIAGETYKTLFGDLPRRNPLDSLPSIKTDLLNLPADSNLAVWFGHSSVLVQLNGKRFLADPNFSGKASPLPASVKAYRGSNIYTYAEIPVIDYLLISHDHYDHLDYETMIALKDKIRYVVCGLGVGAHFERWGYKPEQILERDWDQDVVIDSSFTIHTASTHHFSGRGFTRGKALWMSYLIESPSTKIYISGDGGYTDRFVTLGKKYGSIDWAIMEDGQYDSAWQSVHNLPEQVRRATIDLHAKNLLPTHHSKFTLAKHPWDEPLQRISELSVNEQYRLVTPMIGEVVWLNNHAQQFKQWWKGVK